MAENFLVPDVRFRATSYHELKSKMRAYEALFDCEVELFVQGVFSAVDGDPVYLRHRPERVLSARAGVLTVDLGHEGKCQLRCEGQLKDVVCELRRKA